MGAPQWTEFEHVMLGPDAEYAVRLTETGYEVFRIIDRPPVSRRGFYQIERVWRRMKPHGALGRRVFALACDQFDTRAGIKWADARR